LKLLLLWLPLEFKFRALLKLAQSAIFSARSQQYSVPRSQQYSVQSAIFSACAVSKKQCTAPFSPVPCGYEWLLSEGDSSTNKCEAVW
jgi:hypothetical protein